MVPKTVDFLLAPDSAGALRVKQHLAGHAPGLYRLAGSWTELMALARKAYPLPATPDDWHERLPRALALDARAFWAQSLTVAPRETVAEIDAALYRLLAAAETGADRASLMAKIPADTRLFRRLSDLFRIVDAIGQRPGPLQLMADLLASPMAPLVRLRVYWDKAGQVNAMQRAVLQKLAGDAPATDPDLQALYEAALAPAPTSNTTLAALRQLYGRDPRPPRKIDGVRVLAVRDALEEAEVAAGLIQAALARGTPAADMGLLLPEDPMGLVAVEEIFQRCGVPLSGFQRPVGVRDLGHETVRHFLLCLRKPAPLMAIAALLTSPLGPWDQAEGLRMAQAVMGGDVLLKSTPIPEAARALMQLLDQGAATPADLERCLKRFLALLAPPNGDEVHGQRVRESAAQVQAALGGMPALDWDRLLYQSNPEPQQRPAASGYWRQGLAVFHEGRLPWCAVRHLFVLGFNEGHYPAGVGTSAVFTEAEWQQIAAAGWPVETNAMRRERLRHLFGAQLGCAGEGVTLLLSRRAAGGEPLEPSSSLAFVARSLGVDADGLVRDLDRYEHARELPDLPLAPPAAPVPPRKAIVSDLDLQVDLLAAFGREGRLAPLSPSAAETLMVSPLAWLLGRLGCEPAPWAVDDFDVAKAGTLAHRVFEALFPPGRALPEEADLETRVPAMLQQWTLQVAPFLKSPDWRVERLKFESELLKAARHWRQLLAAAGAEILAAEQWLRGHHGEIPLHGQSDLLLRLPAGRVLVVDYKKAASARRRTRMRKGFDLQAHLYRLMIQTGGLPGVPANCTDIGIVYYLLNDTTALTDRPVPVQHAAPGWEVIAGDPAVQAMQHLDRRLAQIRRGHIQLNSIDDEKWWQEHAGLPLYALDNGPLLRLFMHRGDPP